MSAGWHLVHFASDEHLPHRPLDDYYEPFWKIFRGRTVRIGPPITRAQFFQMSSDSVRAKLNDFCDCELFFPVDDETVRLNPQAGKPPGQRWVCRRMLAMD